MIISIIGLQICWRAVLLCHARSDFQQQPQLGQRFQCGIYKLYWFLSDLLTYSCKRQTSRIENQHYWSTLQVHCEWAVVTVSVSCRWSIWCKREFPVWCSVSPQPANWLTIRAHKYTHTYKYKHTYNFLGEHLFAFIWGFWRLWPTQMSALACGEYRQHWLDLISRRMRGKSI